MVQHEIRKKTRVYGTVAILSAISLVTLIYTFGSAPMIFHPNTSPIKTFSSYEELKNFLNTNTQGYSYYTGGPLDAQFFGQRGINLAPTPPPTAETFGSGSDKSYSTTNIQVAGVDEADIVKTDGDYIYVIANNSVYIMDAAPQNARVLAKIAFNNTYLAGLFLSQDGNKLAVIGSQYAVYYYEGGVSDVVRPYGYGYYSDDVRTFINVYDVSDKTSPVLARNFTVSGSYFNSRMIGNYVYAVISQPAYLINEEVTLPKVYYEDKATEIAAPGIYYADVVDSYFGFTTFVGLNMANNAQEPTNMTIMTGGASNMYVSLNDIYVTYPSYSDGGTTIYRIHINEGTFEPQATGKVPGSMKYGDQYFMDEYAGYFRVATNSFSYNSISGMTTQQNNVYVLNMNLTIVGRLENLATGENLHSVRFMGDKCYLVTFKNIDPLFVIDLSQPNSPKTLGELHIPGYSDYLHPYDATHLIGVGKETVEAIEGDFAWYQGLKLSLFDVSNVNEPKQLSKYVIGDRGTDSPVLSDPKAFLFDKSKNLLVIPVHLYLIDKTVVPPGPSAYGTFVWQGVYVFDVTLTGGFELRGRITHRENDAQQSYPYDGIDYNADINRAVYIGDTLYTVSNARVLLNNLENLALIAKVELN